MTATILPAATAPEGAVRPGKPRVLVVLNSYLQDGPGNLMFQVCRRLAADGDLALEVVALSRGGDLQWEFRRIGLAAEVVRTRGPLGLVRLREWARRLGADPRRRPDVVHTNLLWPDLVARLVLRELGSPVLASTIHGLHAVDEKGRLKGLGYRALDRLTRRRAARFVAISEETRRRMVAAGYDAGRISVIPNGIDAVEVFPPSEGTRASVRELLAVPEGAPLVVQAGQLIERKSVAETLEGFARIAGRFPAAVLAFVGDGPLREALEARAAELGVAERVRFIGHLNVMVQRVMGSADAVLLPSRDEPFGLVIAEAMAAGAPVAVTPVGGLRELVRDGETGVVVASHDPERIAEGLARLLGDPAAARAMGMAGRDFITAQFEINRTANGYRELWKELCGAGR
ncbi:MAG: glycosyltransferase family 4 protein [Candidatus Sumerlaeia bacterium]|nr:glycosyltransferase family 4 protein [Candidatus Sumerlaeia bacterium]